MFGCLCILENDLGWVASMAMTFRVDGDVLLGEALWHSDMLYPYPLHSATKTLETSRFAAKITVKTSSLAAPRGLKLFRKLIFNLSGSSLQKFNRVSHYLT